MDHAVDVVVETDEQAELGDVLDLALDRRAERMVLLEALPGIAQALLEAERDAALVRIDLEHHHLDLLAGRDDLARMDVLLGPAHLGDVDQTLDARLELDERAVVGDVGDPAGELGADRIFELDALPGIGLELLHAERDALGLAVEADHLDLDLLADAQHLGRVVDPAPGDVGDVEQAVEAAEVDEGAVVGDVLDHAGQHLALLEGRQQLVALLGARLLEHRAARDHDVAAAAVHLQDLEGLVLVEQRRDVAHRPDVDLAARQERDRAAEIDREAALDPAEDRARDLGGVLERLLELVPALLAPRLLARQERLAAAGLEPLDVDLDRIADLDLGRVAGGRELLQRDPALGFQSDIDHRLVVLDRDHPAGEHGAFDPVPVVHRLVEHGGEIVGRRQR